MGCIELSIIVVVTARKQSLRRLCFYMCLSVHRGEGCLLQGVSAPRGSPGPYLGGVSRPTPGGGGVCHLPVTATAVDGMHPTGMHSCCTMWTLTFNSVQPISCEREITVAIAPCELVISLSQWWLHASLPPGPTIVIVMQEMACTIIQVAGPSMRVEKLKFWTDSPLTSSEL